MKRFTISFLEIAISLYAFKIWLDLYSSVTYRLSRMYYIAIKMTKLTNEFEEESKMEQRLIFI